MSEEKIVKFISAIVVRKTELYQHMLTLLPLQKIPFNEKQLAKVIENLDYSLLLTNREKENKKFYTQISIQEVLKNNTALAEKITNNIL